MIHPDFKKIEEIRKQPFAAGEIQRLLSQDKTGKLSALDAFYEEFGIDRWMTKEEFKNGLEIRLNAMKNLVYFKELEQNLSTRVEKQIEQTSGDFRALISDLLHHESVLDEDVLEMVRNTREQDILSGEVVLDEEKVSAYMELVREELKKEVFKIKYLEFPEETESKEQMRDFSEKSMYLMDFIVAHGDITTSERNYLKAFLLDKIRTKEGFSFIKNLYKELNDYFEEKDPESSRKLIQKMVEKLWQEQEKEKRNHIVRILEQYLPEDQLTSDQLEEMLTFGVRKQGDVTFDQRIALHLEEIETALFEIGLEKMTKEPVQKKIDEQFQFIKIELEQLKKDIDDFKRSKYSLENDIRQLPESVADEREKVRLQRACFFLVKQEGETEESIRKTLQAITTSEGLEEFMKTAERKAEEYLCEKAQPPFQWETIESMKKNDPVYDVFLLVTEQERYENRPKAREGKPSEYHENEQQLDKIEELIRIMELEVGTQFQTPGSAERFEKAQQEFEKIQEETSITVERLHYVVGEEHSPEQINKMPETVQGKTSLMLPAALWNRHEAALMARDNLRKFKRSRESILKLKNFEGDESQLKEGLAAFFTDYFEVKESKGAEVGKLTKVMSLDHPITAIRFNAADKKPFDSRRGLYDFHKLNGRPATYKERSVALLKTVQDCLRTGDYSQIQKLFNRGEKADRLYMDSLFFPINTIRNEHMEENIVYDTTTSKETGEKIPTFTTKIPDLSDYNRLFGIYKDKESTKYKDHVEKYKGTLNEFDADNLAEDEKFVKTFEETADNIQMMRAYLDSLSFQEDGSAIPDFEKMEMSMGETAAAGLLSTEDLRIDRETLLKIQKQSPLIAARAAYFNSIGRGYALGGLQLLGREVRDITRLPGQFAKSYGKAYWKVLRFYSVTSIIIAFQEFYEHVANLADFGRKFKAYTLLKETFAGTIIGSEFAKLQQAKENERVDAFKGAFAQYGNEDIKTKLLNPRDRFELKATLIEGFDNRGLFTIEDILKNEVFDVINKYTPEYIIPKKYSDPEMVENPDAKSEMTNHVRAALDSIWGQGTWSGYRTNGASKYEANRKASNDNFNNNTGPEKMKVFTKWWEYLTEPDDDNNPLKKIAPSELVGSIENEMQRCNNDSGEIFAIMQALICKGYVRLEHLARLQDVHTNDLPIYTLLEPEQARLSGMTEYIDEELKKKTPYTMAANPIVQFYQGKKALRLKASRDVGKWKLHKNQKSFDEANEAKKIESVDMTAHELQKTREQQPNFIKKSDNGVTGINGPSYSIEKILNAMNRNAQGDIDDARDHDVVALYRGMHEKMAAYMKDLTDLKKPMDAKQFKRTVYNAYAEIGKTSAFATYLAGHEKRMDYDINLADGSPNRQGGMVRKNGLPKELSAFEKLIIPNTGRAQRLNESNDTLDAMPDDGGFQEFRLHFKMMAGYQYTLGVLPNGKKSGKKERYPTTEYRPSYYFEKVIKSFQNFVLEAAKKREEHDKNLPNFQQEIRQSLDRSAMANFDINNDDRQRQLNDWKVDEAELD